MELQRKSSETGARLTCTLRLNSSSSHWTIERRGSSISGGHWRSSLPFCMLPPKPCRCPANADSSGGIWQYVELYQSLWCALLCEISSSFVHHVAHVRPEAVHLAEFGTSGLTYPAPSPMSVKFHTDRCIESHLWGNLPGIFMAALRSRCGHKSRCSKAIVAEKLYARSRGRPAENFAILDKISIFAYHFQFIIFLPR